MERAFRFCRAHANMWLWWIEFCNFAQQIEVFPVGFRKINTSLWVNYNSVEADLVESLIQVVLLCTQGSPSERPKMTEAVRMLEGDGLLFAESFQIGLTIRIKIYPNWICYQILLLRWIQTKSYASSKRFQIGLRIISTKNYPNWIYYYLILFPSWIQTKSNSESLQIGFGVPYLCIVPSLFLSLF